MNAIKQKPVYSLSDLIRYFLKLGTLGFGGPVALISYMHRDLVEDRKWLHDDQYREGLALAQLTPGPLAAQVAIYLGYVHYGILGATLTGLAFAIPSFIMVVLLGIAYQQYGGLSWMQAIFYGISPAVIGIIALSCYKLTIKSIGKITPVSIKENGWLWLFFVLMALVTAITEREEIWLLLAFGFSYMILKNPPKWLRKRPTYNVILLTTSFFWQYDAPKLLQIGWFFTKAGTFVFGSGLAIVPFLRAGVVDEMGWLNEQQFIDSVAVAMITPGPVVITVGFIGYLVSGFAGALVAAAGVFLPCYLFTILPAPYFKKIAQNASIKSFVDGITASVVGALVGSVFVLATRSLVDIATISIAILSILALIYIKKLPEPYIILSAAVLGLLLKTL